MAKRNGKDVELAATMEATADERKRFNAAISAGAVIMLPTFNGEYRIRYVDQDWWYHTDGNGGFGHSWAGCNDGCWADLMAKAGLARHPRFAQFDRRPRPALS
mgnify:CR=1 FL=1